MNYRLLPAEEWARAKEKLASFGQELPHEGLLSVAECGADIRGILCFHLVWHGEPLWIDEDFRGAVDVRKLQKSLTDYLPKGIEYYAFAPSRLQRWIAGTCGMEPVPWGVWKGKT